MALSCFKCIEIKFRKNINLFDKTSDDKDLPSFFTKKWIEADNQSEKVQCYQRNQN